MRFCLTLILLVSTVSCSTIYTVRERYPRNKVFSGTIADFGNPWWFWHGGVFDWPFSFIADTVLLPYTIPRTLINYSQPGDKWKPASEIPDASLLKVFKNQTLVSVQELLGEPTTYTFYCPGLRAGRMITFDALKYRLASGGSASLVFNAHRELITAFTVSAGERSYVLGDDPCL